MLNSSSSPHVSYFTLAAYFDPGAVRYLLFCAVLSLCCVTVGANVCLIVLISVHRSLHQPMYLLLCSLFVNELWGTVALFPSLLLHLLSEIHTVSSVFCFIQIFCVHFYGNVELFTLGVMSYDRYLAICHPLQYHARMSVRKVAFLTALTWVLGALENASFMSLSFPLRLCGNTIHKVYCDNFSIVKLACGDTSVNNIVGLCVMVLVSGSIFLLVLYSYIRILKICFSGCKQTRRKAVNTCVPHLASLVNFAFGAFFEIIQSRFDMSSTPNTLRIFLSLYWLICQPLFNPLMYGLNMTKIRNECKNIPSVLKERYSCKKKKNKRDGRMLTVSRNKALK